MPRIHVGTGVTGPLTPELMARGASNRKASEPGKKDKAAEHKPSKRKTVSLFNEISLFEQDDV